MQLTARKRHLIERVSHEQRVPAPLVFGLWGAETGWREGRIVSPAGAEGPGQLMPGTARSLGVKDPFNTYQSLSGLAKYLHQQLAAFGGDAHKAVAAYNAGPGAVSKYGGIPPFSETQAYVPRVLGYARQWHGSGRDAGGGMSGGTMQLPGHLEVTPSQQGALAAFLAAQQVGEQQRPSIASAQLQAPSFSAQAPLPRGYAAPQASSQAPPSSSGGIAQALQQIAAAQPGTAQLVPGQRVNAPGGDLGGLRSGRVFLAPGADRAGVPTSRVVRRFVGLVAGSVGRDITITTGSNHNKYTTSGNVSDHFEGNAADIGVPIDSREGDMIAGRALMLLGVPRLQARRMAQQGGLYTITPKTGPLQGRRVQVIWRTNEGGDHHNHVHIGIG